MAENTKIEWAHHTFNPWIGCTKVGPGCDHCYAEADFDRRRKVVQWGAGQPRKRTAPSTWATPVKWNAEAKRLGVRYRVFCASLADVFDNAVPVQWRRDLFDLIEKTPHLDWLLLTKRIGNARVLYADAYLDSARAWPANVWLGATVVNQDEADRDIPKLLAVPAAKRFLSMEPLLGPVDLGLCDCDHGSIAAPHGIGGVMCTKCNGAGGGMVDWVIVGGESGPSARPMHPDWARSLRDQCQAAGVPFLFKQWGEWAPAGPTKSVGCEVDCEEVVTPDGAGWSDYPPAGSFTMRRIGKKSAGRLLDGREWNEVPHG